MAYATYKDVEARWRPLSSDEQARATVLLGDAASILDQLVKVDEEDDAQAELLKVVSCDMVIRAMSAAADTFGVTQSSMTAGPYTQSWSYANPSGDLYLTKMEKRLLGITSSYIGSIEPAIHDRPLCYRCRHD
jgi:hypothetical protein